MKITTPTFDMTRTPLPQAQSHSRSHGQTSTATLSYKLSDPKLHVQHCQHIELIYGHEKSQQNLTAHKNLTVLSQK